MAVLFCPVEMQGLKPSVLMGKVNQHLPPGFSPDTDLFLAMFLIRLPLSMHEAKGAGNYKTAAAMVKAADALWDARGSHDPTIVAASPAPKSGKQGHKQSSNTVPKAAPLPTWISTLSKTLAMACVNFTITMPARLTGVSHPTLGREPFPVRQPFLHTPLPRPCTFQPMQD
jgi:hypothetical protein